MSFAVTVLTLFPEMFPGPLGVSLSGQALTRGDWTLEALNIRDYTSDKHRTVDDTPAGGGPGMVMRADILSRAIDDAAARNPQGRPLVYLSPRGQRLSQARARELAAGPGVILICGRFEGIDERVLQRRAIEEISLGDFVLSGGEIAAMALIDACVRLLPGVVGDAASLAEESFESGLLEYPHYTRPQEWEGLPIPPVLMSGHHAEIAKWRRAEAERLTRARRPDLWAEYESKRNHG
jgi:tRNA (guanine37-N1)-methyltransferase